MMQVHSLDLSYVAYFLTGNTANLLTEFPGSIRESETRHAQDNFGNCFNINFFNIN